MAVGTSERGLRERLERRVLFALTGLPRPVKRLLAGGPVRRDGLTLDRDSQLLLRLEAALGEPRPEEMEVEDARALIRRQARTVAGPPLLMKRVAPVEIPGPEGRLGGRLYVPSAEPAGGRGAAGIPLLVYFHGGGHVVGDLDTHDGLCRFLAHHAGVAVLSVGYRLAPEHRFPAAASDAIVALRHAHEAAGELSVHTAGVGHGRIDPARIAVGGDSAGGNLAAVAALAAARGIAPQPAFQLLLYPLCDYTRKHPSYETFGEGFLLTGEQMDWYRDRYLPVGGEAGGTGRARPGPSEAAADWRCSPLACDDLSGVAAAYVATAGFDPLRDEGEAYAEAMRRAGAEVAVRRHPSLLHSFANQTAIVPAARSAMLEAARALRAGLSEV